MYNPAKIKSEKLIKNIFSSTSAICFGDLMQYCICPRNAIIFIAYPYANQMRGLRTLNCIKNV